LYYEKQGGTMKIAVISETSSADKNSAVTGALENRGFDIINAGMKEKGAEPELTYIQTGFLTALYLNTGTADLVVGGCGTGQGFLISAMQYPGVFCGLIIDPADAWLFRQINGGNCISLPLNKGFGWAADINLRFLFDRFFEVPSGQGYPAHRQKSQQNSLQALKDVNKTAHNKMSQLIRDLPDSVVLPALKYPGSMDSLVFSGFQGKDIYQAIQERIGR
jgi:ribose 5-phosphate isomerase RpiB